MGNPSPILIYLHETFKSSFDWDREARPVVFMVQHAEHFLANLNFYEGCVSWRRPHFKRIFHSHQLIRGRHPSSGFMDLGLALHRYFTCRHPSRNLPINEIIFAICQQKFPRNAYSFEDFRRKLFRLRANFFDHRNALAFAYPSGSLPCQDILEYYRLLCHYPMAFTRVEMYVRPFGSLPEFMFGLFPVKNIPRL